VRAISFGLAATVLLGAAFASFLSPSDWAYRGSSSPGRSVRVVVAPGGQGDFRTIQQAIDHAPLESNARLIIAVSPGVYQERVVVPEDRPGVTLLGLGKDPAATVITYSMSAAAAGGTFFTSTVDVEGRGFEASNLTIENSYGPGSQAVALSIHSDRAVVRDCRLLGWQDTLYAASGRQFYDRCFISGAIDFIFGNARAVFNHCEIHSAGAGYITAESRMTADGAGGFVFNHCRLTGEKTRKGIYLGRPWRPYARVVFLNTWMGDQIDPAGWREWHPGETHSLETAYYAEYNSSGPGGSRAGRDPHAKFLTATGAKQFETRQFLSSPDGWDPTKDR
jgi:pectin methylesterase-like acyl-CoA thioesterase